MYQVLIVEDSKLIIRDLKRILNNSQYEAELWEAYDGANALELLGKFKPDIIFSDIKMQIMNGLDFIEKAKEKYPQVKCVIISGYSDFEFTHQALRLQVDDYIMKPVDEEQLLSVYHSLIQEIDVNKKVLEEISLQNHIQQSAESPLLFLPKQYIMIVVRTGILQELAFPLSRKEIEEHLEGKQKKGHYWIVDSRVDSEKIVLFDLSYFSPERVNCMNRSLLTKLSLGYNRVNLICSGILDDKADLREQYEKLHYQLKRNILFDRNNVYFSTDEKQFQKKYIRQKEEIAVFQKKFCQILKSKTHSDYEKVIRKQVSNWKKEGVTVSVLRKYILVILDELFISLGENTFFTEDPGTIVDKMINSIGTFENLENELLEYGESIRNIKNDKFVVSVNLLKEIINYMKNHMYDNLTLQEMAEHFELSASYLCRTFKVYYNDTPISFYNQLKIQEAKRIIEEYQDMKIKAVAELLGFSDPYYFSKVFKQQYGVSPSVFRAQVNGERE